MTRTTLLLIVVASLACSCAPVEKLSPTSVTPQEVLALYRHAAERPAKDGLYRIRFRTTGAAGDVAMSDYFIARGNGRLPDYREITVENGLRTERGRVGDRSWEKDANGLVFADPVVPTVFDRVLSAAVRKADPRVRVLGITEALPHRYVIEIAPNPRIVQRRYFDTKSGLLTDLVTRDYNRSVAVDRFSYVWVGGAAAISRALHSDDLSTQKYETTVVLRERLPFDATSLAIPRSRAPFSAQSRLPATINSIFGAAAILVRADIAGTPYWLKLDSGASDIVLDRGLVQRLGLREFGKVVRAKGGKLLESSAIVPRIDIGPMYATNLAVRVLPHDYIAQGVHIVGLLGCDFIASKPLLIDFRRESVTAVNAPPARTDPRWIRIATPSHRCTPSITIRVARQQARLVLDTGAPESLLNDDVFERLGTGLQPLDATRISFIGGEP